MLQHQLLTKHRTRAGLPGSTAGFGLPRLTALPDRLAWQCLAAAVYVMHWALLLPVSSAAPPEIPPVFSAHHRPGAEAGNGRSQPATPVTGSQLALQSLSIVL